MIHPRRCTGCHIICVTGKNRKLQEHCGVDVNTTGELSDSTLLSMVYGNSKLNRNLYLSISDCNKGITKSISKLYHVSQSLERRSRLLTDRVFLDFQASFLND